MFEALAADILDAVQELRAQRGSGQPDSGRWRSIRDRCKEVIVFLEVCGRQALANRVEREHNGLKQAWHKGDRSAVGEHRLDDAAEELAGTLVIW